MGGLKNNLVMDIIPLPKILHPSLKHQLLHPNFALATQNGAKIDLTTLIVNILKWSFTHK